jgi:hypothetical protein
MPGRGEPLGQQDQLRQRGEAIQALHRVRHAFHGTQDDTSKLGGMSAERNTGVLPCP